MTVLLVHIQMVQSANYIQSKYHYFTTLIFHTFLKWNLCICCFLIFKSSSFRRYICLTWASHSNRCESLGKITVKTGTQTSDAECSDRTPLLIVLSVIIVCGVLFIIVVVVVVIIKKTKKQYSVTSPEDLNLHP